MVFKALEQAEKEEGEEEEEEKRERVVFFSSIKSHRLREVCVHLLLASRGPVRRVWKLEGRRQLVADEEAGRARGEHVLGGAACVCVIAWGSRCGRPSE